MRACVLKSQWSSHTVSFEMTAQTVLLPNDYIQSLRLLICFPWTFLLKTKATLYVCAVQVTYKELPGHWSWHIEDGVHVCILLLDLYFQTEGIDKVWSLLLKNKRTNQQIAFQIIVWGSGAWPTKKYEVISLHVLFTDCKTGVFHPLPEHKPGIPDTGAQRIFSLFLWGGVHCF